MLGNTLNERSKDVVVSEHATLDSLEDGGESGGLLLDGDGVEEVLSSLSLDVGGEESEEEDVLLSDLCRDKEKAGRRGESVGERRGGKRGEQRERRRTLGDLDVAGRRNREAKRKSQFNEVFDGCKRGVTHAPSTVPSINAPFNESFMFEVPEASVPAVEI